MSTFVHFMNTFILVPPQRLINEVIKGINKIIEGLNKPFRAIRNLDVLGGLKIFGKKLSVKPFTKIIPDPFIPLCPYLPYKCIDEPDGYKSVWGYSTPKECKTKTIKKKKKTFKEKTSGLLSNFIVFLILMLFGLFYIGNHEGYIKLNKSVVPPVASLVPSVPSVPSVPPLVPSVPPLVPSIASLVPPLVPSVPPLVPSIASLVPPVASIVPPLVPSVALVSSTTSERFH